MNSETKIYQIPEFTGEHIPVKEAARIMGKDSEYIRLGLIEGFLPIGSAYKRKGSSVYTYYISPKKFWEYTGYVYKGTNKET